MAELRLVPLVGLAALSLGCISAPGTRIVAVASPINCQPNQTVMVRDALTFGRSIPGGGMVSDSAFDAFLAAEVTPAFPSGFTVMEANGQWRETSGKIAREPSRVLVVLHPEKREADSSLEQIRRAYMQQFSQEAVMWERTAGCVSF